MLRMMDQRWRIGTVEIRGGFLDGTILTLPPGLTCIIGPRGSGKSTLAEAIRFALAGNAGADKQRKDLFQSNLARAVVTITTAAMSDGSSYVVRREAQHPALVSTAAGVALPNLDLERGSFLPVDAYSSKEIEDLADRTFSGARRALIDELRPSRMPALRDDAQRALRVLDSNAADLRSCRRDLRAAVEEAQALAHVRERLAALPPPAADDLSARRMQEALRQSGFNLTEKKNLAGARDRTTSLARKIRELAEQGLLLGTRVSVAGSVNAPFMDSLDERLSSDVSQLAKRISEIENILTATLEHIDKSAATLEDMHRQQALDLAEIRSQDVAASEAAKERAQAEADVVRLDETEREIASLRAREETLLDERRRLRRDYNAARDAISDLREEIAEGLEAQAGKKVRISVRKNADKLTYRQMIENALKGVGVRLHEAIVDTITNALRPDELAHIISSRNYDELERIGRFGPERARKILDGLHDNADAFVMETVQLDDEIAISLDVGTDSQPILKDASNLSRGQKCTALLPLLLARRDAPLVIDQPEDNLDNHFIFNTVVETITQLKNQRQMIFITHNANIPVLAEADLIVVLDSDGKTGSVKKTGTLDGCKSEIIDLLEGGREAFERRGRRYGPR